MNHAIKSNIEEMYNENDKEYLKEISPNKMSQNIKGNRLKV